MMLGNKAILTLWVVLITFALLTEGAKKQQPANANPDPFQRAESGMLNVDKPYIDKSLGSRYFDHSGDTMIRNDRYIRLTPDRSDKRGSYFSKVPLLADNFQIEFEISIHGEGTSIYGDGMAFWLVDKVLDEGPVFGSEDKFNGLGLFFDTYKNDRPGRAFPYVLAMLGDGKTSYDNDHDGAANEIAGCSVRGLHNADTPTKVRLTMVKGKFLSVEMDYRGRNRYETCFHTEDIPEIPNPAYMGFSAQTGELSENHDLLKAKVYALNSPPESFAELDEKLNNRKPSRRKDKEKNKKDDKKSQKNKKPPKADRDPFSSESSSSGWLWWFVKSIFYLTIISVLGYGGYTYYRLRKRNNRDGYIL